MSGWGETILVLAAFAGSHFLPRVGGLRERTIGAFGRRAYFAAYGLLSLGLLIWLVVAAGRAPYVELWPQTPWSRWVPNLLMPFAAMLVTLGIGAGTPFTLGGRRGGRFDPAQPGFAAVTRHPLLLALILWAGAHLFPNGDLAHVILFGSFVAMALVALLAFDAKARRVLGPQAQAFFAATALLSRRPFVDLAWLKQNMKFLMIRGGLGVLIWMAALHMHTGVIGLSPFPI